ncbi:hypothetical protein GEMRC1_011897 [Eukaryota sp. GEM-RC1]
MFVVSSIRILDPVAGVIQRLLTSFDSDDVISQSFLQLLLDFVSINSMIFETPLEEGFRTFESSCFLWKLNISNFSKKIVVDVVDSSSYWKKLFYKKIVGQSLSNFGDVRKFFDFLSSCCDNIVSENLNIVAPSETESFDYVGHRVWMSEPSDPIKNDCVQTPMVDSQSDIEIADVNASVIKMISIFELFCPFHPINITLSVMRSLSHHPQENQKLEKYLNFHHLAPRCQSKSMEY